MSIEQLRQLIEQSYDAGAPLGTAGLREAVEEAIASLDRGEVRVAEPQGDDWVVNEWLKKAILLYFRLRGMETMRAGDLEFHDKIPVKADLAGQGVRVVPPGVARYGSFLEPGAIMMPSYVNIGAWVGRGSMVDTWATVGSCAQIGRDVHLAGGVGIGGVLEPPTARPVIIEDGVFVGSRCVVVEGVRVRREAVLGANTVLNQSIPLIDLRGPEPVTLKGEVPERAVVVPGTRPRELPGGMAHLACAYVIGERKESTDRATSLNDALREHGISA